MPLSVSQTVRKEVRESESAEQEIQEAAELEHFQNGGHLIRRVWDTEKAYEVLVMSWCAVGMRSD